MKRMVIRMNRKTRGIAGAVATAALVTSLTACAGSGSGSASGDTLEVWFPTAFASASAEEEKNFWNEIFAPFEAEHDVTVNVTLVPWASYEEKYLTGVSSNEGPDVGYMYTEMMGDYVVNGALAPFDGLLADETLDKQLYLPQGQVDGQQYAMPFVVGGIRVLYGNMDLLASVGIEEMPTTWDELLEDSAKLSAAGITPMVQEWGAPDRGMLNATFYPLLWQAGGDILTDDGTATAFNSDEGIAAAEFLMELIETGAMPSNVSGITADEAKTSFHEGRTAFAYGSDAGLAEIQDVGINAEFVPSPKGETEGTFVASDSLVMLESCDDKQLCADLVAHILNGEQMSQFHEAIVSYPPVATDEEPMESEFLSAYQDKAEYLHSMPIAAGGAGVYNSLYQNLQQMILGEKTPAEALADAAEAGDAALAEAQ